MTLTPLALPNSHRGHRTVRVALAAAISWMAVGAHAAPAGGLSDEVHRIIGSSQASKAPGCAAGLYQDGKAVLETAAGYADIAGGKPLTPDTQFYAASLSKQFTALTAIRLVEAGRLDLDQDIRRYIPRFPDYGTPVTARMLMHHSSGLRDWLHLARFAGTAAASLDKRSALELVLRQRAPNFEPGTRYLYSNSGYLLLAEIVERVSGEPFARHAERTLLRPLGMANSFFMDGTKPESPTLAHGYVGADGTYRLRDNYPRISGSGGLITTLADLARFEAALAGESVVVTPFARKLLLEPGLLKGSVPAVDAGKGLVYGGGVAVGRPDGRLVVRHGGSADGFTNLYVRYPEQGRAIILLCNQGGLELDVKASAIDAAASPETQTYLFRSGEQRTYHVPEVDRYYQVVAGDRAIEVSIGESAESFGTARTYTLQGAEYLSGTYALSFAEGGRVLTISSSRATGLRGTEVDR